MKTTLKGMMATAAALVMAFALAAPAYADGKVSVSIGFAAHGPDYAYAVHYGPRAVYPPYYYRPHVRPYYGPYYYGPYHGPYYGPAYRPHVKRHYDRHYAPDGRHHDRHHRHYRGR